MKESDNGGKEMANQDAIRIIKTAIAEVEWEYPIEYAAAFDRAIDVLEQEPCEDAISRQAAIDAINKIHPVDTEYDCTLYDKIDVMYILKDLPSIKALEQEPVLDKIRAEIGQLPSYAAKFAGGASAIHIDKEKVLQIIDKYKE